MCVGGEGGGGGGFSGHLSINRENKSYKRKLVQEFCKDLSESTSSTSTTFEGDSDTVIYNIVDDVDIETPSVKIDASTNNT